MVDLVFTIASKTRTHQVSQAHVNDVIDTYKAKMAAWSPNAWPDDGQGGKREPTALEVADWVASVYLFNVIKEDTRAHVKKLTNAAIVYPDDITSDIT